METKKQNNKNEVHFLLALHNHQPLGNFEHVFKECLENAYGPFLKVLAEYPEIKITIHYSGILLEWIKENEKEYFNLLKEMVSRGQVEIMGGGFYEPILPVTPRDDCLVQIKKLSSFIEEHLETRVEGLWLAERTYEPHLSATIAQAGIGYTVMDDSHFFKAGFQEDDLKGYYLTEEGGTPLKVFPISEKLRYMIPFEDPKVFIDYCQHQREKGGGALILADDGEKFGSWPGTKKHVYEDGWLVRFFDLLKENSSWLKTTTYREYTVLAPPKGLVYLPAGSYREMLEWSNGFWRNFFVRYPESNHLHKKMLYVRQKVRQISDEGLQKKAYNLILKSQCNDAYWHGVFGGLYLNFLRSALYSSLLEAEAIADKKRFGSGTYLHAEKFDLDYDGKEEVVVSTEKMSLVFSPDKGGSLVEFSYKPKKINLGDTLSRRKEKYHRNLFELARNEGKSHNNGEVSDKSEKAETIHSKVKVKEKGLEKYLLYDAYRRTSLREHILPQEAELTGFIAGEFRELGDFLDSPYNSRIDRENHTLSLEFSRQGEFFWPCGGRAPLKITKKVLILKGEASLYLEYYFENPGEKELVFNFAPEFNFALQAGHAVDRYYDIPGEELVDRHLASFGEHEDLEELYLVDEYNGIKIMMQLGTPARLWRFPLETISQSEGGIERIYQGSVVMPLWLMNVKPGEKEQKRVLIALNEIEG